jgi:hypothetical protein
LRQVSNKKLRASSRDGLNSIVRSFVNRGARIE